MMFVQQSLTEHLIQLIHLNPSEPTFFCSLKHGCPTRSPQICIMRLAATFLNYIYTYCKKLQGNLSV